MRRENTRGKRTVSGKSNTPIFPPHPSTPSLQHPASSPPPLARAVFLDRDGTLNEMVYDDTHGLLDSPRRPSQVRMISGAGRFLRGIRDLGYLAVAVTNQPGVAKGTLTTKQLDEVNARLLQLLRRDGDGWDAIYTCPHHPQGGPSAKNRFVRTCGCRKPKPGLLLRAAREHGIRLTSSWMIGDGLNDVQAGRAAGCRTILVTRLKVEQIQRFLGLKGATPDAVVPDLAAALRVVRQGGAP